MTTETRTQSTASLLYLSFELGSTKWKLAFASGLAVRPRIVQIPARDLARLEAEIVRARTRLQLAADAPVCSCYEAGREGFWLHRVLLAKGIQNVVVDPSSIAVDRRKRRVKTDRVDATALVIQLIHAIAGDRRGWRELHVPTVQAEADRHLQREWATVVADRKRIRSRLNGLLATQGTALAPSKQFVTRLRALRLWDGAPVPEALVARLEREWQQLQQVEARVAQLRRDRRRRVKATDDTVARQTRQLAGLRGIGEHGALILVTELYAWRQFRNGRQVGASVGLTPTPYRSDQIFIEQGISQSGNRRVRALSIELAWCWLRWQPKSALTQWFYRRFGDHGRARRIGIVAVARKLLVALWRYVTQDIMPEGATVKA